MVHIGPESHRHSPVSASVQDRELAPTVRIRVLNRGFGWLQVQVSPAKGLRFKVCVQIVDSDDTVLEVSAARAH